MTKLSAVISAFAAAGTMAVMGTAAAQSTTIKSTCQNVGGAAVEPFGTEPGHALRETTYSCTVNGGPLHGAATTVTHIWHVRGNEWTLLTGQGAMRRPDGIAVHLVTEGTLAFQMNDGKVTGWTANGKGRYLAASGAGTTLGGKN